MITIRFATIDDLEDIMRFIGEHWRKGHILSINKELLLRDFQDDDRLNFAIALDEKKIQALFGFMLYSKHACPDITGSIWKNISKSVPLLGLKVRKYTLDNIAHRTFVGFGANPDSEHIYKTLKIRWVTMDHYYLLNKNKLGYKIAKVSSIKEKNNSMQGNTDSYRIKRMQSSEEAIGFDFQKFISLSPYKDYWYFSNRFFNYPIYCYESFHIVVNDHSEAIVVCRRFMHEDALAYRIVDYYGDELLLKYFVDYYHKNLVTSECEYLDFVCYGFDEDFLRSLGFDKLNHQSDNVIIPNYFEPFIQRNIKVFGVIGGNGLYSYRVCKADGDQDRPNMMPTEIIS